VLTEKISGTPDHRHRQRPVGALSAAGGRLVVSKYVSILETETAPAQVNGYFGIASSSSWRKRKQVRPGASGVHY
jgi:hypothetical protein